MIHSHEHLRGVRALWLGGVAAACLLLLAGCSEPGRESRIERGATPRASRKVATATAPTNVVGSITVGDGSMLERDIIPQLATTFSLSEDDVKSTLAAAKSDLIGAKETGFRRMEGMIPPGEYMIHEGDTLELQVNRWVADSGQRYDRILTATPNPNGLSRSKRLALASMIEAECLSGQHQREVATVFLNRLATHSRLQSCVSAEYALGYQRPYLLYRDVEIDSKYNTYVTSGLPAGPICSVSDAALGAATSKPLKSDIRYFFYDYVKDDIFFYSDYEKFSKAGSMARTRFEQTSKVGAHDKVNKQKLY